MKFLPINLLYLILQENEVLTLQLLQGDPLNAWERRRRQMAERTILVAAKIISHSIATS